MAAAEGRRWRATPFTVCGSAAYRAATAASRHIDQFAAAAKQRLRHGLRRLQPAQRVGDRVAAEHRAGGPGADESPGDRGVVAERRPVRLTDVTGDAQPHPSRPGRHVIDGQAAAPQRGGPRGLDHDVGGRQQVSHPRRRRNRLRKRAFRSSSSRRSRGHHGGCRPVGPGFPLSRRPPRPARAAARTTGRPTTTTDLPPEGHPAGVRRSRSP